MEETIKHNLTRADLKSMSDLGSSIINKTNSIANDYSLAVLQSISSFIGILVPHVKVVNSKRVLFETDDNMGKLPLLTEEELCSLKDFLKHWKDYRLKQEEDNNAAIR